MTGALIEVAGNITADPELRFTQNGTAVATFNVAHTPRRLNRDSNTWEDAGDTLFLRVNVWREQAENIAHSLRRGNAVLIVGRLVSRPWEDKDGNKRTSIEVEADVVSLDLRRQRIDAVHKRASGPAPEPAADAWAAAQEPAQLRSDVKAVAAA